ncbi:exonuclease domain-containing protein [Streptomyces sp. NPDC055897]
MSWHRDRLCGFDLETTGVDVEADRIVTAAVVCCGGGLPTRSLTWLADPGVDIPEGAAKIHGVTTEQARAEGRPAAEVIEQITAALVDAVEGDVPIVAMNAAFDLTLLDREARRHGVTPLVDLVGDDLRVVDPRVLDKHIAKYRSGGRTLTDLCTTYEVPLDGAHSADADALAACRLAWRMGMVTPTLAELPLHQLHEKQIGWAREQGKSLADYFRRTPGKEVWADSVRTEWPLIPHQRSAS